MMKNKSVRVVLFMLIFVLVFSFLSKTLTAPSDYDNYQRIRGFYDEEKDSLDAIYIGSSNCFAYWNAMAAWNEYGIAVYSYASNDQPLFIAEELIKETRKTQKDAVYIININTIKENRVTEAMLHYLLDYMPFSLNKIRIIDRMADVGGYSFTERFEYYVTMLRYHSRWNDLKKRDFGYKSEGVKGTSHYRKYLEVSTDISEHYGKTDVHAEISNDVMEYVTSLLDFLDAENIEAVFVAVPQARTFIEDIEEYNTLMDVIEARGYDTLSIISNPEEIGLDLAVDYYDKYHTNIHGSLKFTNYVANYLVDKYQFTNKKDNETYRSWNTGYKKYLKYVEGAVLDLEMNFENRLYDLASPKNVEVCFDESVMLSWDVVDSADGYAIYRKSSQKNVWEHVKDVSEVDYMETVELDCTYTYTVVPYKVLNDEMYYGNFDYYGVNIRL